MITKKETIKNELDRRYERQYGTGRKPDNAWLNGRGERAKKNNKLVSDLKREQKEQYENTNNELQERIALEMQNLKIKRKGIWRT